MQGASATNSGLLLLPMLGAMLLTSLVVGRITTNSGRYKIFPILGPAVAGLGMYLLSSLDETTSTGVTAFHMLILGLGLGIFQVIVVSNARTPTSERAASGAPDMSRPVFHTGLGG